MIATLRGVMLGLAAASALAAPNETAERARIRADRRNVETQLQQTEQGCRGRFAVTACVEEAKVQRRASLAKLREQQVKLDDDDRRRRAAERLQTIDRKRDEKAAQAASASAASADEVARKVTTPRAPSASRSHPAPIDGGAQAAARRAQVAERRHQEAEKERAKIARRLTQRKKIVAPLPPAVGSSAASAAKP